MPTDIEDLPSQQAEQTNSWEFPMPISQTRYAVEAGVATTFLDVLAAETLKYTSHYGAPDIALIMWPCAMIIGGFLPYFIRARKKEMIALEISLAVGTGLAASGSLGMDMHDAMERYEQNVQALQQKDITAAAENVLWQPSALRCDH